MPRKTYVLVAFKCKAGHKFNRCVAADEPVKRRPCEGDSNNLAPNECKRMALPQHNDRPMKEKLIPFSARLYPYFDPALDRPFHSAKERADYMKANGIHEKIEHGGRSHNQARHDKMALQWRLHTGRYKVD